jgi:hypothetical protein
MADTQVTGVPAHASTPSLPSPTPCRPWCDHDGRFPTVHESAAFSLPIPAGLDVENGDLLSARISVDDDFGPTPDVTIGHAGDGVGMSPAEAIAFADDLIAFADQIRTLATGAVAREAVAA